MNNRKIFILKTEKVLEVIRLNLKYDSVKNLCMDYENVN